jgi:cytochrome c-type biogenesis protein CcmH
MKLRALAVALAAVLCLGAAAGDPAEVLHNPAQEARARALFQQVRCLVCQNESIDDSEAPLADDLRKIVRQQIASGRSDAEIKGFLVQRYGEFVLMRPAFSPANAALWLSPFVVVGLGAWVVLARRRRTPSGQDEPSLTLEEQEKLQALDAWPIARDTVPPQVGQTNDQSV